MSEAMTEAVKRYDVSGYGGGMVEAEDGGWYHEDDYARLEQECERLRGKITAALSVFPICVDRQKFRFNGQEITADGNDCFYGVSKVDRFLNEVHAALSAKP